MTDQSVVEVTDRDGWVKQYPIEKTIVHIGSDPRNDIVLDNWHGSGIAPRHIQVIRMAGIGGEYRLVNLGPTNILLSRDSTSADAIAPQSAVDITGNEQIKLGDFTLTFRAGESDYVGKTQEGLSKSLGLQFTLPQNRLAPDSPIDGTLLVRNRGRKDAVQFRLEVLGIGPESYELGPAPIIFPEAEREVFFTLIHTKKPVPVAGEHRVTIRATAPDAYPGETVSVSQVVNILPYYSHTFRLMAEAPKK